MKKITCSLTLLSIFICADLSAQPRRPSLRALYIKAHPQNQAEKPNNNGSVHFDPAQIGSAGEGDLTSQTIRPPKIDGLLNEPIWKQAEFTDDFMQREPREGTPASERTEVRVLYDNEALYVGFKCFDSEPEKILAKEMRNDSELDGDDNVRVIIDTYLDRRNGFHFQTNPRAARIDAQVTDEGRSINSDWNIVWEVQAQVTDEGWEAEFKIPLNQLRYPKSGQTTVWGINFAREIRRKREDVYWAPILRDYGFGDRGFYKISKAGDLTGLEQMPFRKRLEITPFNLSGVQRKIVETDEIGRSSDIGSVFNGGFDLKYGLTANLIADMTVNTDFAQVEADQERTNLTRFNLFFPEKRDFFLEGAGIFGVGGSSRPGRGGPSEALFYSRKIGLVEDDDGAIHEVPLRLGSKISGNLGGLQVGFLDVVTDRLESPDDATQLIQGRTNYSVFRARKPVLAQSSIGALVQSKDALSGGDYNRIFAVDGAFAFGGSTTINSWLAKTQSSIADGDGWAGNFSFRRRTDRWNTNFGYTRIDDDFNNEMGFIQRTDIRRYNAEIGLGLRPKSLGWMRRIYNAPQIRYLTDGTNTLQTRQYEWTTFLQFEAGHVFFAGPKLIYDNLDDNWTVFDFDNESKKDIVLAKGAYEYFQYDFFFRTDESKPIAINVGGSVGEFFSGTRYGGRFGFTFKPSPFFSWELNYSNNFVQLPDGVTPEGEPTSGGDFNTNVLSTRLIYTISRDMFAKAFVQWNDRNESLSFNLLYNFYYRPGSNIYIVFNQLWDAGGDVFQANDRAVLLKADYWLNL